MGHGNASSRRAGWGNPTAGSQRSQSTKPNPPSWAALLANPATRTIANAVIQSEAQKTMLAVSQYANRVTQQAPPPPPRTREQLEAAWEETRQDQGDVRDAMQKAKKKNGLPRSRHGKKKCSKKDNTLVGWNPGLAYQKKYRNCKAATDSRERSRKKHNQQHPDQQVPPEPEVPPEDQNTLTSLDDNTPPPWQNQVAGDGISTSTMVMLGLGGAIVVALVIM